MVLVEVAEVVVLVVVAVVVATVVAVSCRCCGGN